MIGHSRASEWAADGLARNDEGFFLTGPDLTERGPGCNWWWLPRDPLPLETSTPEIFAVGDVRFGSTKRVASAVGEGAMAIHLVHQYLRGIVDADAEPIARIMAAGGAPERFRLVTDTEVRS